MNNNFLISFLIIGKNDNYGADANGKGGVGCRINLTLNKLINNVNKLNVNDIELVLCDWGSENKIIDNLVKEPHKNLKYIYVPKEIGKKYNPHFSISHSYNCAFRKSNGRYVVFLDSDCYIEHESFVNLYNFVKQLDQQNVTDTFYWASRYQAARELYNDCTNFLDLDQNLKNNPHKINHEFMNLNTFRGCAGSLLFARNIGEESSCWFEKLPNWGWQDIDLHYRLVNKYKCGNDLNEYGIKIYHLYHHDSKDLVNINPQISSQMLYANSKNWGLINEDLRVVTYNYEVSK